ncbi:hypothetical protein M5E82_13155 [Parabacteroides distasonis]|nr:hypothetical protein M5E82_13155 [Parabacteroides distasonis]
MRYLLLTAALAMNMQAMVAQSSYQVKNSVTLRNEDCDLTKMSVILPVPVSNIYQDVVGLKESSGMVLDLDASNRYLRDIKTDGQPSSGESYTLSEEFSVTLYPVYIDMAQFTTLYPYDTESAIYKRYTADKGDISIRAIRRFAPCQTGFGASLVARFWITPACATST